MKHHCIGLKGRFSVIVLSFDNQMVKISMCMTGISNSRVYVRRGGKVGYLRAAMIEQIVHKGSENFGDFSIAAISSCCHSLMASARYNHSSNDGK